MTAFILGLDFDNTIVSYEGVFHRAALDKGLISADVGHSKDDVRGFLRASGREDEWTALQGDVYGARMDLASLYEGVADTIRELSGHGIDFRIISHKTLHPFLGPQYDLHEAARRFLARQKLDSGNEPLFAPSKVFFELTIEEKLARIEAEGCTHFLDDLPEVLNHPRFPEGVTPLLFDPLGIHKAERQIARVVSWRNLPAILSPG